MISLHLEDQGLFSIRGMDFSSFPACLNWLWGLLSFFSSCFHE